MMEAWNNGDVFGVVVHLWLYGGATWLFVLGVKKLVENIKDIMEL
jgi:hypothetical protein